MVSLAALSLLLVAGLSTAEVYNSVPARIEDYPSVVQIEVGFGRVWVQYCVGTILTTRHVLSAAHCFYGVVNNARFGRVRAGSGTRGRDGAVLSISNVNNHPSFTGRSFEADITVIHLSSSLTFSTTTQQSPITGAGLVFPPDVGVIFAGWGRTTLEDVIWADRGLKAAGLRTVALSYCTSQYASLPIPITITEEMICTGEPGQLGTNLGLRDTGAPIFYDGVLVGVVAFGSPLGESYPLVATSVSSFSNWIIQTAV